MWYWNGDPVYPFLPSLENLSGNLFKSNCGEYLQQPSYLLLRTEVLVHGLCFKVEREIFLSQRLCVIVFACKDGKDGCWCERPLSNDQWRPLLLWWNTSPTPTQPSYTSCDLWRPNIPQHRIRFHRSNTSRTQGGCSLGNLVGYAHHWTLYLPIRANNGGLLGGTEADYPRWYLPAT